MLVYYAAWEWLGISLEFTAGAWARLPRFFWAVVGVNLSTHPLFVVLLETVGGRSPAFVLPCEAAICLVEWGLLCAIYRGRGRWRLLAVSLAMNVTSYLTSLLIDPQSLATLFSLVGRRL